MAESNYEKMMRKKAEAEARKAEAEAKMMESRSADRLGMKKAFVKDIAGAGPQKEMRDIQTGAMKDLSSGAAARRGAEAGLRAQIAGAGGRPGGAAAKRGLIKAGEAGVMGAGAQAAGSAAQVAGLAGKVRGADVGISKADKTARMKFHQLRMGEELAREGMKAQVSAASAGRSCFIAGTMVTMADGSKKKIEHVLVGEKVLGLDNKVNTVLDYNRPPTAGRSLYSINDGKAFFTHEHPFYTLKGWKAINPLATFEELKPTEDLYPELLETTSLEIGDELVTVDGVVKIESIKEYEAEFFTQLYNFLLDGDHTYFADEYLVHNGGGKASGGEMLKRLSGSYTHKNGKIKGAGTETSDSIKARLSDGEFVVNAKTVRGLGEALGAKGKHPTRQKGSAYLYALQSKYGDKKDKDTKGILPVKMSAGGFTGMDAAKIASQVAKTGILGKGAKAAGDIAGAGIGAHEEGVKAKKAKVKAKEDKDFRALQTDFYKSKAPKPVAPPGQANAPKVLGPGMMPKTLDEQEAVAKDGGEIKFGKGVKVRKKFLDSIGHKPFKHFEDKAEKDYKEGQTGYKNLKKQQSSSVPGFPIGAGVAAAISVASTAAAMAKAEADRKKAIKAQEAAQQRQAGVEAGKGLASSAQGIMKQDAELKDGGKVEKRSLLQQLDDYDKKHKMGKHKRKPIDLDPEKKSWKAVMAKKGSVEPVEMKKGGDWRKAIADKMKKKYGHVMNEKALRKRISKAIKSEADFREGAKGVKSRWSPEKIKAMKKHYTGKKEISSGELKEKIDREAGKQRFLKKHEEIEKGRIKDTGDAKRLEEIGKGEVLKTLRKRRELDSRERGKQRFLKKHEEIEKGRIKDTGDAGRLEEIGKKQMEEQKQKVLNAYVQDHLEKRKHTKGFKKYDSRKFLKQYLKSDAPQFTKKEFSKAVKDERDLRKGEKAVRDRWTPERLKQMKEYHKKKALKEIEEDVQEESMKRIKKTWDHEGDDKKLSPDRELERSLKDPKARAFLMKQGRFKSLEDMPKGLSEKEQKQFRRQFFEKKASDRVKQDDKEAKQYEKKTGLLGKLGDRLKTGEWFGSSKDILAAKRKAKDREQAKREKSEDTQEAFDRRKAAQDDKIAMAKEMAAERKKGIEAKGIRETKSLMAKPMEAPKPKVAPKVAPKVDAPGVKKKKPEGMTSKDWADMGLAAGLTGLGAIAKSKKDAADRKAAREKEIRVAKGAAGKSLSDFGTSVMGMDTKLKKGGRVSFKDVLKAKKKIGY